MKVKDFGAELLLPPETVDEFSDRVSGYLRGLNTEKKEIFRIRLSVEDVLEDFNGILLLISQWFTRLIPVFVFAIVVKSVWTGEIAEILLTWKSWVITTAIQLVVLAVTAARNGRKRPVGSGKNAMSASLCYRSRWCFPPSCSPLSAIFCRWSPPASPSSYWMRSAPSPLC